MSKIIETVIITVTDKEYNEKVSVYNINTGIHKSVYIEINTLIKKYGEQGYKITTINNLPNKTQYYLIKEHDEIKDNLIKLLISKEQKKLFKDGLSEDEVKIIMGEMYIPI